MRSLAISSRGWARASRTVRGRWPIAWLLGPILVLANAANAPVVAAPVAGNPTIAVASSLRHAWPALEAAWQHHWPELTARPTFGASHTLARQIARGAPFELLLAADEASIDLIPERLRSEQDVLYAAGKLALIGANGLQLAAHGTGSESTNILTEALTRWEGIRIAIADPDHAPYGRAAREVLTRADLWPLPTGRLITGENAAQALQFLLTGAVNMALVPASLVVRIPSDLFHVTLIDPAEHTPLIHRLVVLETASPAAQTLGEWFVSAEARDLLAAAGFAAPP